MNNRHKHLLTFDVEHWYEGYIHRRLEGWKGLPPRDHVVVEQLFELLSQYNQRATFFFTGRFAREFPVLVKTCSELGHEVASHSDEHRAIYRMDSKIEFREDLKRSLDALTSITGKPVFGFRSPKWSLTDENQNWVLEELVDAGLIYDSSFFPTLFCDGIRRRGEPQRINLSGGRSIIEVPATGFNLGSITLPVAGGFYFRAFPAWFTSAMLAQKKNHNSAGMLYVHPYDLDTKSPHIAGGGLFFRLFRTYGTKCAWKKLEFLLSENTFEGIDSMLNSAGCRGNETFLLV